MTRQMRIKCINMNAYLRFRNEIESLTDITLHNTETVLSPKLLPSKFSYYKLFEYNIKINKQYE